MKTAISISDETFKRIEQRVAALGLNRSEFFSVAAVRYLDELDRTSLTDEINESIARSGGISEARELARQNAEFLAAQTEDDEW